MFGGRCSRLLAGIAAVMALLIPSAGLAAQSQDAPVRAVLTFEEPVYAGMPVWVHVKIPEGTGLHVQTIRYPFAPEPWDMGMGMHRLEVTKDGKPVEGVLQRGKTYWFGSRLVGGTVAPPTSPSGRIPLHLLYKLDKPGKYLVRYEGRDYVSGSLDKAPRAVSEWTELKVKAISESDRLGWRDKLIANAPTDPGLIVGDYLPSLLASPDERVLQVLLEALYNPDPLVQRFALYSLYYYEEQTARTAALRVIVNKGPTMLLARDLGWNRTLHHASTKDIVASLIPRLASASPSEVGATVESLLALRRYHDWNAAPELPQQMERAVLNASPHIMGFEEQEALWPFTRFLGSVKTSQSRELLWKLATRECVRSQALSCLCDQADKEDLPRLGNELLQNDDAAVSLPSSLHGAYGASAAPYLLDALARAKNERVRINCAQELLAEKHPEAVAFFKDAILNKNPYKGVVVQTLRIQLTHNPRSTDEELLRKLDEISQKRPQR